LGVTLADRAQLEQVVLNLAVNARDAMPGGGHLTIATGNADLDADYARDHVGARVGPHVKLVVSDTGVGMTAEVMEHAFEPFFTTKARGKGTGLGLSTVIGIVAQSGGSVDVESAPGKGSVFTIYLPRLDGTVAPSESADTENPSIGGHETILVAEDEEAVRNFVVRVLRQAGYRVLHASNGQEALALAEPVPSLDLLFTDMVMPGMSGPELIEKLEAVRPGVRTLLASGYAGEALDLEATGEVPGPYLPKPFTAEALLARVRLALDAARDGTDRKSSPKDT
jgi:CheY-like chemotaxis protein